MITILKDTTFNDMTDNILSLSEQNLNLLKENKDLNAAMAEINKKVYEKEIEIARLTQERDALADKLPKKKSKKVKDLTKVIAETIDKKPPVKYDSYQDYLGVITLPLSGIPGKKHKDVVKNEVAGRASSPRRVSKNTSRKSKKVANLIDNGGEIFKRLP